MPKRLICLLLFQKLGNQLFGVYSLEEYARFADV